VIIFKVTAIGYIVDFSASTIRDFGLNSLADKVVFVGKLIIFSLSMPIIYGVLNLLVGVLK
jgi:stage III sporulation protein AD